MVAILVTPPQDEPVTRDEAKAHARVDGAAEDSRIDALIKAARIEVENRTGRSMVTQGWRIVRDAIPRGGIIRLAPAPVASVDAVTVYGEDGAPHVLEGDAYQVDLYSSPGRLCFNSSVSWSARSFNGIEVDLSCGYGDPAAVPAPLKHAILMLVAYWFDQREAAVAGAVVGTVADGVAALLAPYRIPRLV